MHMKVKKFREPTHSARQLSAFEATARHQSVGAAAAELDMDPRDISWSVRELEAAMGTLLFTRRHGTLGLTQAGERLYRAASTGLDDIREAPGRLHRATTARVAHSHDASGCPLRTGVTVLELS